MRRAVLSVCIAAGALSASVLRADGPGALASPRASDLWLVPAGLSADKATLGAAVEQVVSGRSALALPALARAVSDPVLGGYALLYQARASLALGHPGDASMALRTLFATHPAGHLSEAALLLNADLAESVANYSAEIQSLQAAATGSPESPAAIYLRIGRAALASKQPLAAAEALTTAYYEYPLADESSSAGAELAKLAPHGALFAPTAPTFSRDLKRAQQLYDAKVYSDARKSFAALRDLAADAARTTVDLRLAECDFALKRYPLAYEEVRILLAKGNSSEEAEFLALGALREVGRDADYVTRVRQFVDGAPTDPLAGEALNDLGSYYTRKDDDPGAAAVFADLYQRFPTGPHADRAAWKAGWWDYKNGRYADAAKLFESAADGMRHADYRPSWLYWTARSYQKLGDVETARRAFRRVVADYRNWYYGRRAAQELDRLTPQDAVQLAAQTIPADAAPMFPSVEPPVAAPLIRALLGAGMYDDAVAELRYTQRASGSSPLIEATIAYALNRRGDLRPAITTMRRAYPQFLAEGGEALPASMLAVIFPVQYWELIKKYSALHKLDPSLMAALINQESTFDARVRSSADAWGLMQVLPSTGREYARTLGIAPFRTTRLTDPETNIRIGTAFFADMLKQYGGDVAVTLAAYNAGGGRADKWMSERPGVDRDQFIDDIPFAETQNYVKRVMGSAEDYRLLYETGKAAPAAPRPLK